MLRRDTNATFEKTGIGIFSRMRFAAGQELAPSISCAAYKRLQREQQETPVCVLDDEERGRAWWLFRDRFYLEAEGYTADEVKALALEAEHRRDRRLVRAVALMEQVKVLATPAREPIPDDVRIFVWQRDGGRCVRCHGKSRLEFDHVIPLALGGGGTARNLQLLCETCNREKGASLV